ncbi:integrase catalytic domain-containing protein [Trichonephila clavipes]|nr:integrase catalytic domain-containing protein [Trichonephila clavipes]
MSNLPYERVNMAPPFSITGLDLGGPYFVTYKNQRKGVLNKIYVCVCICSVTRAIHLEILSDLTSDAIIATLKRFMSRRGKCSKIFTDNATNFVDANSQLKAFYKTLNFPDQNLAAYFTEESIEWNFIPPISNDFDKFEALPLAHFLIERKGDDREGQCNVWYNGNCKGAFTPVCNWPLGCVVEVYHGSDALSGSLPQINLGVQGVTQGGHHSGTQRVNLEFRVGSNFRIIPEQYFLGVENVVEFLENMDNNLTYYEMPTQLACAYLKGHLTGWALDWFEVLGYRVVEDKVRTSDFGYVEVRNPQTISNLLQIIDKYEERFLNRKIRGSSWKSRDIKSNENNCFPNRNRQENWRETRGNNRYADSNRPRREFNRFESQGVVDNQRFDGRRRGGQSDHRFLNQGGRKGGSKNSAFRGQNDRNRYLNF